MKATMMHFEVSNNQYYPVTVSTNSANLNFDLKINRARY